MNAKPRVRPARDVAGRLLVVASACAVASDASLRSSIVQWLKRESLWASASPVEKAFLEKARAEPKEEIHHSWGAEARHLEPPTDQAPTGDILDRIPAPGDGYDIEVAQERHRAINWLTCYENAEWDDVATDT